MLRTPLLALSLVLTLGLWLVACSGTGISEGDGVSSSTSADSAASGDTGSGAANDSATPQSADAGAGLDTTATTDTATTTGTDAGALDATPEPGDGSPDGQGGEGYEFGDPCETNDDCYSGLCGEHMGDSVCTKTCENDCPAGWSCEQVTATGGDPTFICVSSFEQLCKPCISGDDCTSDASQSACVDYEGQGSFCGAMCEGDLDCPEGFICQQSVSTRGGSSNQCVDVDGICECSTLAAGLGLTTTCSVQGEVGTCEGTRTCTPEGLTDCDAATPTEESCDGVDNDCDGETDDVDCDDLDPCTTDSCEGIEGCLNAVAAGAPCDDLDPTTSADTCTDTGECVGEALVCPDGPCVLETTTDGTECLVTYANLGAACDDLDATTKDDQCDGSETCEGEPYTCEIGVCELGATPNGVGCDVEYALSTTACDDEDLGTKDDRCDGAGGCEGTPYTCEPTQCQKSATTDGDDCVIDYKAADVGCDDGLTTTKVDICDGSGGCEGTPYTCEPTQCQASSTADGVDCVTENKAGGIECDDGLPTTMADVCDGLGSCDGTPYTCTPGLCELTSTTDGEACDVTYAAVDTSCDDGLPTTMGDLCDGVGGCQGTEYACMPDQCEASSTPNGIDCDVAYADTTTECDDGDPATKGDACDGTGTCVGESYGCVPSQCEASSEPDGEDCEVTYHGDDVTCDDGDPETLGDLCDGAGGCAGQPYSCEPTQCEASSTADGVGCAIEYKAADVGCDDGEATTKIDICDGFGGCAGQPYTCTKTQCEASSEPNGVDCTIYPKAAGILCDDGQSDTKGDLCDGDGGCDGTPYACPPGTCEVASTPDGVGCVPAYAPAESPCDDQDPATKIDICDGAGGCQGAPYTCTPTQCELTSTPNGDDCDVVHHQGGCVDDDLCSTGETCSNGVCGNGSAVTCDDNNPCTVDPCYPAEGCGAHTPLPSGTPCPGGVCDNSACVTCISGQTEVCNPQCGTFSGSTSGYKTCVNNAWGTCQPVACAPGNPTYYQAAPMDHEWHCNLWMWPGAFTMYLCLKATPTFSCGSPAITFQLQKSSDAAGNVLHSAFDNNVGLALRNVNNGHVQNIPSVPCAGQSSCSFTLSVSELTSNLGLTGAHGLTAEVHSPPGAASVGTTGPVPLTTCY